MSKNKANDVNISNAPPTTANKGPLSNFPSVQDRKRIVGCLVVILATSYAYDNENDDTTPSSTSSSISPSSSNKTTPPHVNRRDSSSLPPSDDDYAAALDARNAIIEYKPNSIEKKINNGKDELLRSWSSSSVSTAITPTTSSQTNVLASFIQVQKEQHAPLAKSPSILTKQQSEIRRKRISRQDADKLAIRRHRRRRHEISSKLLQSACDLLFLDKMDSRAFAPMLHDLSRPEKTTSAASPSSRRGSYLSSSRTTKSSNDNGDNNDTKNQSLPRTESSPARLTSSNNERPKRTNSMDTTTSSSAADDDNNPVVDSRRQHLLQPFLQNLTPGSGFQSIALLLLRHLLASPDGYDPRVRFVLKQLAVVVLSREMSQWEDDEESLSEEEDVEERLAQKATRRFEALERSIAVTLMAMSAEDRQRQQQKTTTNDNELANVSNETTTRSKVIRGLKIGSAGVVAGTLFALTGGLAAPGIAAGVAAIAGSTLTGTAAVAVTALTSTTAVTAIFGVGGGGLAAYKMQRRTKGLTEFEFHKEDDDTHHDSSEAELFTTICLSGWLRDKHDFRLAWGVMDKTDALRRFLVAYRPESACHAEEFMNQWKGKEKQVWMAMKKKYGRDPDDFLPRGEDVVELSEEEKKGIEDMIEELGYPRPKKREKKGRVQQRRRRMRARSTKMTSDKAKDEMLVDWPSSSPETNGTTNSTRPSHGETSPTPLPSTSPELIPWDYHSLYSGELYTVRWESDILLELCSSVADLARDFLANGTREVLKHTILSALVTAVALPVVLVKAANIIDSTWTLTIERADEAGVELARCLMESEKGGRRPVVLMGYSMGARVIYSCLKELARLQEEWEERREEGDGRKGDLEREPASIVEDVILMGTPLYLDTREWSACRRIVAGRLVNCYSKKDMILALMFQYKRIAGALIKPICGVSPVKNVSGVENYDVTSLIQSHSDYCVKVGDILKLIRHGEPMATTRRVSGGGGGTVTNEGEDGIMNEEGEIAAAETKVEGEKGETKELYYC